MKTRQEKMLEIQEDNYDKGIDFNEDDYEDEDLEAEI